MNVWKHDYEPRANDYDHVDKVTQRYARWWHVEHRMRLEHQRQFSVHAEQMIIWCG